MFMYDSWGELVELDEEERIVECNKCSNLYEQRLVEQVPGFRDMSYDTCPYCGYVNQKSMSYEFYNKSLNS